METKIIWVRKEAVEANCDQRAEIITFRGDWIYVIMCGSEEPKMIKASDIVGVELTETLTIKFSKCSVHQSS